MLDAAHSLVRLVGATVTPEAAVVSLEGKLLYLGRIDDPYFDYGKRRAAPTRQDLRDALDTILSGKTIAVPTTKPIGCFISNDK